MKQQRNCKDKNALNLEGGKEASSGTCLAVDLGGTKLLIGEVDRAGNILQSRRYDSSVPVTQKPRAAVEAVLGSIHDYIDNVGFCSSSVAAIGMGMIGRVDSEHGLWFQMDAERSGTINVVEMLEKAFGLTSAIDNDVHCAVSAENKLGWGRQTKNYIYMNIGTGIAAGFIVNGELIRGANYNAGEIGHHVVSQNSGILCTCGRVGCVEAIASGYGLDKRARALLPSYPGSRLPVPENGRCKARDIFRLADEGDALCMRLADDAVAALADTIMNLVRVSDPDTVVLGGGIVSDGWILPRIRAKLNATTMRFVRNGLVMTELNPNHVGLVGAAMIGFEKLDREGVGKPV